MSSQEIDYSKTLYLPRTDFPMRASLPEREPQLLEYWQEIDLYGLLRRQSKGKPRYIVHDGPPYANGHIHIGHALNKILKDVIVRAKQMEGYDSNLVPGWDCHGLPIEWKIEEDYRSRNQKKEDISILEFRQQCRNFAMKWVKVQSEEFVRLGVMGDFSAPYKTMDYSAEARIARELLDFAMSGQLYRGSKPIMWSVVERTALAEAEVEYHDHVSDTVFVKFPIRETTSEDLKDAFVVIWTTTPWSLPGNRAVAYSSTINYGLYSVVACENDYGPQVGEKFIFADNLAQQCGENAKISLERLRSVESSELEKMYLSHPFAKGFSAYDFVVPVLEGAHVTDGAGTGFVHTAPSHGREDFDLWIGARKFLEEKGIETKIPFPIDDAGYYTEDAPGFGPDREGGAARVIDDEGKNGDANSIIIKTLIEFDHLFARGRLKHSYPHSWRSKKPIIFRNTPQWFVYMDKLLEDGKSLRQRVLEAVETVGFVPASGQTRLQAMLRDRPDWVLSRQRAWGVPICIFVNEAGEILKDETVNKRIIDAFLTEGADAWFAQGARERFLGEEYKDSSWQQVYDILDVWFDSGCTHSFVLEDREELCWPADLYLEGSDQHRGWFQSSLLESCATRGKSPYKNVVTHGFTLDENGKKMSKSLGNAIAPQEITQKYGADILRLWVMTTDYWEDQKIGRNIIQTNVDSYRKLRNVIRWMLGTLAHDESYEVAYESLPALEKFMLHRLKELDKLVKESYNQFDFKRIAHSLLDFAIVDLSAFYFDIRKDSLYCDGPSSLKRQSALYVIRQIFDRFVLWLAPMLPFTAEEAWLECYKDKKSIHLENFLVTPDAWENVEIAQMWKTIRLVRKVVTGALEQDRMHKIIGSSLESAPIVYINDAQIFDVVKQVDMAEICITSAITIENTVENVADCFSLEDVKNVYVKTRKAEGKRCARSWRYTNDVGLDEIYKDVSARDAKVLHELAQLGK